MQKIIFGLLLLLSPYCAHALTIKGKVTDKNTGEELIGAYVSVKENTKLVSVTGLDGSYSLQAGNTDPYTLVCTYMGYKTTEVTVGQEDATVNVELEPAAEMLALAGFKEGHNAQAFPSFGSERTGAPVVAFARLSPNEIRLREPIQEPDVVLIQDRTLLDSVDVFAGLRPEGYVLINSSRSPEELGLAELVERLPAGHVRTLPATRFALEKIGRPLPGAAMLAGFAALTGMLRLESVQAAYAVKFSGKVAEANADIARLAWDYVKAQLGENHA